MIITSLINTVYYYLGYGSACEINSISLFAHGALKELSNNTYELSCAVNGRRFSFCSAPRDPQVIVANLKKDITTFISCIIDEKKKIYSYQKDLIIKKNYAYDQQATTQMIYSLYKEKLCDSKALHSKSVIARNDCLKLVKSCGDKATSLSQKIADYNRASARGRDAFWELLKLNVNFCDALFDISIAVTNFCLINKNSLESDLKKANEEKLKQKEIAAKIFAEIKVLQNRIEDMKKSLSTVQSKLESIDREIFETLKNIAILEQMILMLKLLKIKCEEIDGSLDCIEDSFKKNKKPVDEIAGLVEQIKGLLK